MKARVREDSRLPVIQCGGEVFSKFAWETVKPAIEAEVRDNEYLETDEPEREAEKGEVPPEVESGSIPEEPAKMVVPKKGRGKTL